ncbi:MAG: hypothetical protein ATN36_05725 [Epulopiscium sp. Nele67-Bin005]|nr:MAG: hypothetical protein ATN36_05725 [Epulopiscium sp. Nele67-Bin005]
MNNVMSDLEKIIPEGIEMLRIRYRLLQSIYENQPVGRRKLSQLTTYAERLIRNEIESLVRQELVMVSSNGVSLTLQGEKNLDKLYAPMYQLEQYSELEDEIAKLFNLNRAIVVKGNSDENENTKWRLSKAGSQLFKDLAQDDFIIAITGGTTISRMIDSLYVKTGSYKNLTIIPARGSLGQDIECEANNIAIRLSHKVEGVYELLNIPDKLGEATIHTIRQEPYIQHILQMMQKSDMIIFGLGDAFEMAQKRQESCSTFNILNQHEAVLEVFRYYFNKEGTVIHNTSTIGLDLDEVKRIPYRIAIAGGKKKAVAIYAARNLLKGSYLVLDEAAAKAVIEIANK